MPVRNVVLLFGGGIAVIALLGCLLYSRLFKRRFEIPWRCMVLAIAVIALGFFLQLAAAEYVKLIAAHPGLVLLPSEPEYFAVQTATTVGYGSALLPCHPNASPSLVTDFQLLTSWLMLVVAGVWGVLIGATVNVFSV